MKKVLKIEIIMDNPILLLDDKSFHLVIHTPIPVPELIKICEFYTKRGYEYLNYSKLDELDFSTLQGFNAEIYTNLKQIIERPNTN